MAGTGNRGQGHNIPRVTGSTGKGHRIGRSFGAENDYSTPTTPSTPSTASTRNATGNKPRKAEDLESRYRSQRRKESNPRVERNLEMAYAGDDSDLLPFRPTHTINPPRPRTLAAGYDKENHTLFIRFRGSRTANGWAPGAGYEYHNVTPSEWREVKTTVSTGRLINSNLNYHPYNRADW